MPVHPVPDPWRQAIGHSRVVEPFHDPGQLVDSDPGRQEGREDPSRGRCRQLVEDVALAHHLEGTAPTRPSPFTPPPSSTRSALGTSASHTRHRQGDPLTAAPAARPGRGRSAHAAGVGGTLTLRASRRHQRGVRAMILRVLAILVLVLVAAVAIRLAVGFVAGIISAVLCLLVAPRWCGGAVGAVDTESRKRERSVQRHSSYTHPTPHPVVCSNNAPPTSPSSCASSAAANAARSGE